MALTDRQKKAREGKMTASRIATIVSGDDAEIYELWLELTGDPSFKPPDFSKVWPVQLGNATEKLHLDWLERGYGTINGRGKSFQHPEIPWALCTLDGWLDAAGLPVEAKHVGGFEHQSVIIERYMPQMHWTMYCTDTTEIMFSTIRGAKAPEAVFIKLDQKYLDGLIDYADMFMRCVFDLREPVPNPYVKPPLPVFSRVVDMTGNNLWATAASRWTQNLEAHTAYEFAAKEIKAAVPADAKEAFGHGIIVRRSKTGALTIKPKDETNGQDQAGAD